MSRTPSLRELFQNPDPPPEVAALVLARDVYPQLDVQGYLDQLDQLAEPLARRIANARTASAQAAQLGTYVYDQLGFHGDEEAYYDPRNSYLNEVLERKAGIPISLALVLIALGRRAGANVEGVGFPGHFLVRLGGEGGVFLDPFFRARILNPPALEHLARRALGSGAQVEREHLAPVGTRAIIVRMLTNLKAIYESRREHARALVVCDRLVDLAAQPEHRRDRAMHAIALGSFGAARDDLEAYLSARPGAKDVAEVRAALERARGQNVRAAN